MRLDVICCCSQVWLCSGCRRNFGRHKKSFGAKTYLIKPAVVLGVPRPSGAAPSALDIMLALAESSRPSPPAPRSRLLTESAERSRATASHLQQAARQDTLATKRAMPTLSRANSGTDLHLANDLPPNSLDVALCRQRDTFRRHY